MLEVAAEVEIIDLLIEESIGTYTTPFSLDLLPGTYHLVANYSNQRKELDVLVESDKITSANIDFIQITPKILPLAFIGAVLAAIAILMRRK